MANIGSAGNVASAPAGMQTTRMGYPASSTLRGPADASRFVAGRIADGADYIKVIVEDSVRMGSAALDGATIVALVKAAHQAGLKAIAHVTTIAALTTAAEAGVDILTHAPINADVDNTLARTIAAKGIVSVPTLIMMRTVAGIAERLPTHGAGVDYTHARSTVSAFYRAGVIILAGTDAHQASASPASIPQGKHSIRNYVCWLRLG